MIDYNTLLEKWGTKLGLDVENPIGVCFSEGDKGSKIHWDRKNNRYIIRLNTDGGEMDLIHELGHIWLGQIYNNMKLAHGSKHIIVGLAMKDNFVNYHLSKNFEEFYQLKAKDLKEYLNGIFDKTCMFDEYLRTYLLSYIHYYYIFNPNDKERVLPYIKANLKTLRDFMIKKNPKLTYRWFQALDTLLNRFRKIKDIRDSNVYYEYRDTIIKFIGNII